MEADVIIIGGGCAGLSLAAHLSRKAQRPGRVLVLEQRQAYEDDRSFSFWRQRPMLFSPYVSAAWDRWCLEHDGRRIECADASTRYETIRGGDFYAAAQGMMAEAPGIDLHLGVTTSAIGEDAHSAWAETSEGRVRAALVVDTRPPAPRAHASGLLQMFTGWEIETPRPVFDAGAAELMLFDSQRSDWVGFSYVLPFSPTRALVEYTRFAACAAAAPQDIDVLARVTARAGRDFRLLRRESGTLAMRVEKPAAREGDRILRLGTLGGAARAATGYAFTAIQAQAASLAGRLQEGCPAAFGWRAPQPPFWLREMDRIFLRVLRNNPSLGPALFAEMFSRCPPAALVRFLAGGRNPGDALRVIGALPARAFLLHGILGAAA